MKTAGTHIYYSTNIKMLNYDTVNSDCDHITYIVVA